MSTDDVGERFRVFVQRTFRLPHGGALEDDASLLASGIVDSLGVLELVNFAEQEFRIVLDNDDLLPENFESIAALARLVERKRQAAPRAEHG
jgi:acyl carrier protein